MSFNVWHRNISFRLKLKGKGPKPWKLFPSSLFFRFNVKTGYPWPFPFFKFSFFTKLRFKFKFIDDKNFERLIFFLALGVIKKKTICLIFKGCYEDPYNRYHLQYNLQESIFLINDGCFNLITEIIDPIKAFKRFSKI